MTKPREPLSIDAALARIAGQVEGSWSAMAAETGYAERTVRKWGDADTDDEINFRSMLKLDLMFQRGGGEGHPIHAAYSQLLQVAIAERFVDQFELLRRASRIVKETGDAEAALLHCALPDASLNDMRKALKEVLEALDVMKAVVPVLEQLCSAEEHNRGPPQTSD